MKLLVHIASLCLAVHSSLALPFHLERRNRVFMLPVVCMECHTWLLEKLGLGKKKAVRLLIGCCGPLVGLQQSHYLCFEPQTEMAASFTLQLFYVEWCTEKVWPSTWRKLEGVCGGILFHALSVASLCCDVKCSPIVGLWSAEEQ